LTPTDWTTKMLLLNGLQTTKLLGWLGLSNT
jgi:hypothetical protein